MTKTISDLKINSNDAFSRANCENKVLRPNFPKWLEKEYRYDIIERTSESNLVFGYFLLSLDLILPIVSLMIEFSNDQENNEKNSHIFLLFLNKRPLFLDDAINW